MPQYQEFHNQDVDLVPSESNKRHSPPKERGNPANDFRLVTDEKKIAGLLDDYLRADILRVSKISPYSKLQELVTTEIEIIYRIVCQFLEKSKKNIRRFLEIWCLSMATFFSGFLSFYFIKMLMISYKFQERSEGADEILIWIPQVSVALGSTVFFICILHNFILLILKKNNN